MTLNDLFPEIEPFEEGRLKVSDLHDLYYEQSDKLITEQTQRFERALGHYLGLWGEALDKACIDETGIGSQIGIDRYSEDNHFGITLSDPVNPHIRMEFRYRQHGFRAPDYVFWVRDNTGFGRLILHLDSSIVMGRDEIDELAAKVNQMVGSTYNWDLCSSR